MKTSVVVIARNHEYGTVSLKDRAIFCLNSLIDTFDEVIYVDWASPDHSLLYDIKDNLNFKGNLKHFVITPQVSDLLTVGFSNIQKPCEVLARNIGIRRVTGDWIVSTNIDIICPSKDELVPLFKKLDQNTMYTISRRGVYFSEMQKYHEQLNTNNSIYQNWKEIRNYLNTIIEENTFEEKVLKGDDYSLINCCGDFQCAPKHIWESIRGMEEDLIYSLYADTNVQKKAAMHGFGLKALYSPALFHIEHGKGGGGFLDGINKKTNDPYRAIVHQNQTQNLDTWGFSDIEIEYEIF
jgi:hypothetical protein